jgi:CheY-like chemotaxis protein
MLIIPGPQITGQGEDILLVDDNTADLRSIHQLLVHLGFNVTSTSDPQKALNIFRNKPDKFVLLITDQVMPRMKGIELATKVLEIREDVPVIVCSGSEEAIQELQNSRTDIHAYIHKPFSKTQLMEAMQRVLS